MGGHLPPFFLPAMRLNFFTLRPITRQRVIHINCIGMPDSKTNTPFPYDAFCITVLLAVSCGSIVIALAQVEAIIYFADKFAFLVFLTMTILAALFSVLAAFFKHQQKDCKNKASESLDRIKLLEERGGTDDKITRAILLLKREIQKKNISASKFARMSAIVVKGSLLSIVIGFIFLLVSMWYAPLSNMLQPAPDAAADTTEDAGD